MNTQKESGLPRQRGKNKVMATIAYAVTFVVLLGTIGIAIMIACSAKEDAVGQIAQILLPLWGTWFGTILAFYFSKENLDYATNSNMMLLNKLSEREQEFASKSAFSVMKPFADITTLSLENDGELSLLSITNRDGFSKFNRFPVINNNEKKEVEYVIHRLIMVDYLFKLPENEKNTKTLNDFLSEMKVQNSLKDSIGFVSESATLLDVKKEMDKREKCENVFVTKDGMNSGAVIGWITDRDIYKHGKV